MWTTASADEEFGLVYLPMGNSAVDYWSSDRSPQENEFSTALVALDGETGEPRWRFQTVYKDVWDYDLEQATPSICRAERRRLFSTKQGEIYILDRVSTTAAHRDRARRAARWCGARRAHRHAALFGLATLRRPFSKNAICGA